MPLSVARATPLPGTSAHPARGAIIRPIVAFDGHPLVWDHENSLEAKALSVLVAEPGGNSKLLAEVHQVGWMILVGRDRERHGDAGFLDRSHGRWGGQGSDRRRAPSAGRTPQLWPSPQDTQRRSAFSLRLLQIIERIGCGVLMSGRRVHDRLTSIFCPMSFKETSGRASGLCQNAMEYDFRRLRRLRM